MKITFSKFIFICVLVLTPVVSVWAQTELDNGIQLYKQADYNGAISSLKKATKSKPSDTTSWYYLGLSYLMKSDTKNALKNFKKALELAPADAPARIGLAYVHILKNNSDEAEAEARKVLESNAKNPEAHYILGVASFRRGLYNNAYENANKAITVNANFAAPYLLKSESLTSSFAQQSGTVNKAPEARNALLVEAAENLEKYLNLSPNDKTKFYQDYLNSLKFFAEYYKLPENQLPKSADSAEPTAAAAVDTAPLKILSKPRPSYTDAARQNGVTGIVRLLIGFAADGNVKHILVINPLSHGLSEQAVRAARGIKFNPATKDGKPISVVKTVEYSFSIY